MRKERKILRNAGEYQVPFVMDSIAVALVLGVHTVLLQAAGTLTASVRSPTPVSVNLSSTQTSNPPAERWTVCGTETHIFMIFKHETDTRFREF